MFCPLSSPPALSGEAGVPFIQSSASEFIDLFVGVGASQVTKVPVVTCSRLSAWLEPWLHSSACRMWARLSLKTEFSRGPATREMWLGSLMKPSG